MLVIEVGDSERNPHAKMSDYMRDGPIATAWRIDIQSRSVEVWQPHSALEPVSILSGENVVSFGGFTIVVRDIFVGLSAT